MVRNLRADTANPMPLVAIVTGAGGGIGRALSQSLAERGYRVVLGDRCEASLTATLQTLPPPALGELWLADVVDETAWQTLAEQLIARGETVGLLVNCAGVLLAGRLADSPASELRRVVEVNLLGAMFGCRAMAPLLAAAAPTTRPASPSAPPLPIGVLNVASIFAPLAPPGFAAYNASKAGLVTLTQTLRGEWGPLGMTATAVLPGITRTGLFKTGSYTADRLAEAVTSRGDQGTLSAEFVARESLRAYALRREIAPIGRRAGLRYRLLHWLPGVVRSRVRRDANRLLEESS
ncbi:SDR family NAD(P)-dependent oxidoreductase [Botrimarina hoheduenensis]|uniref:Putative oxidoreductase SadH n=1 Tax=Botrimarina hoheduenensis TaxID=2528000 RepID=A0A5C5VQB9_9BACT|nr:SDR family oxidoreductase [Botrimarina hoheduenensis]TWT40826.1 putative oxidoreductase SadH [Botrimarina hoheduenensis]